MNPLDVLIGPVFTLLPFIQQICNDVLDYKILTEYQVNRFIASDGTRPFILAPDTQYISVSVKYI